MTEKFDPRFDAAFQPGFSDRRGRAARAERSTNPAKAALEAAREHAEQVVVDVESDHEVGARRPNPFLIALLVLSLALIVGGVSAVQAVRSFFSSQDISADMDYISYQMLIYAAPISIALGIAIAAGVLFIYAINWHKRP